MFQEYRTGINTSLNFLTINMICGMQRVSTAAVRAQRPLSTLFSYSHPRSWRADGIPPDGYHPGQLFSPLRGARVAPPPSSIVPRASPCASKKPRDDFMWWKKSQKTAGFVLPNSRTAGCCSVVETKGEPQSSTMYAWDRIDSVLSTISRIDYRVILPSVFFATLYI